MSTSDGRTRPHRGIRAVEEIRRMGGGSQSQLMRCSDNEYYVVKFQNNPQGTRTLANDLFGTLLARSLGLPALEPAVVWVGRDMVRYSEELYIELKHGRIPCLPGLCFGSRYPRDEDAGDIPVLAQCFDPLMFHSDLMRRVENVTDFPGMLVFDAWTCNVDARQTLLFLKTNTPGPRAFRAAMVDQGCCFNANGWSFPEHPRKYLFSKRVVYECVTGIESFEPWLSRVESELDRTGLEEAASQIPKVWYADDTEALARLIRQLDQRRSRVRRLLFDIRESARDFFPGWTMKSKPVVA